MRRDIIVSQRASIQSDRYLLGFPRREIDFRESLEFLDWSHYWRIHRSYVKLGSFRSGAFAGIGNSKADSDRAVIITLALLEISFCENVIVLPQYYRTNIEIRVAKRSVR